MSGSDKEGADKMAGKRSVIPFGPQHPVLPEPIHIDLVVEDEKVVEAVPSIGFVHRGLESLVTKKDFGEMVYVAERICGICSFGHGYGYVNAIENIMGIQPTDRARFIRTILFELSRMHSHILWLGLMADAFGFESLFMETWKYREKVLDMLEKYDVVGSFFLIGDNIEEANYDVVKRAYTMGCDIENHSQTHSNFTTMTVSQFTAEVNETDKRIYNIIGEYPKFFRAPYTYANTDMYENIDIICWCIGFI